MQQLSYEEQCLLAMLKEALGSQKDKTEKFIWEQDAPDWSRLFAMAKQHAVLPMLYDILEEYGAVPEPEWKLLVQDARSAVLQSYRMLFLTRYLIRLLQGEQITAIVLKGVATASFYPTPEVRKSGDIDLLVPETEQFEAACRVMEAAGLRLSEEQHANHHVAYRTKDGIDVELHSIFSEPFDQDAINRYMRKQTRDAGEHCITADVMGVPMPMLGMPHHAYQLLLHMLQHFLRAGFGLKLVCDWVVISREKWTAEEKAILRGLTAESKIEGFAEMITAIAVYFLGLEPENALFPLFDREQTGLFVKDILEAEEFGNSSADRMVALRGSGVWSYIREFHYQMRLTYPRAGKCILCWPVLWVMALIGFVHRNRMLRHVSTKAVLQSAKQRSRLRQSLHLFEK